MGSTGRARRGDRGQSLEAVGHDRQEHEEEGQRVDALGLPEQVAGKTAQEGNGEQDDRRPEGAVVPDRADESHGAAQVQQVLEGIHVGDDHAVRQVPAESTIRYAGGRRRSARRHPSPYRRS